MLIRPMPDTKINLTVVNLLRKHFSRCTLMPQEIYLGFIMATVRKHDQSGKTSYRKGEETQARIMLAATAAFAEQGYEAASLRNIARASNIQVPGLYKYFNSKESLYEAVLKQALTPFFETLDLAVEDSESLLTLPRNITYLFAQEPYVAALMQQALMQKSDQHHLIHDYLSQLLQRGKTLLNDQTQALVDDAKLTVLLVSLFSSSCGYFLSQELIGEISNQQLSQEQLLEQQVNLLEYQLGFALT